MWHVLPATACRACVHCPSHVSMAFQSATAPICWGTSMCIRCGHTRYSAALVVGWHTVYKSSLAHEQALVCYAGKPFSVSLAHTQPSTITLSHTPTPMCVLPLGLLYLRFAYAYQRTAMPTLLSTPAHAAFYACPRSFPHGCPQMDTTYLCAGGRV